jgi:hypothetical protein
MPNIMHRAWEIFREDYRFPTIPYASIGRHCFAASLRKAWAEKRAADKLAATNTATLAADVADIAAEIASLSYAPFTVNVTRERSRLLAVLAPIAAALDRRPASAALPLAA